MRAALIASLFAALGTGLGGGLVALFPRMSRSLYDTLLGFSAGVMLVAGAMIFVASDQLIPESRQRPEAKAPSLGIIAGFLLVAVLTELFA